MYLSVSLDVCECKNKRVNQCRKYPTLEGYWRVGVHGLRYPALHRGVSLSVTAKVPSQSMRMLL